MPYKVYCLRCKTEEYAKNKIEADYLMRQHERKMRCFEADWKRIS